LQWLLEIQNIFAVLRWDLFGSHFLCADFAFNTHFWFRLIIPAYIPPWFFSHIFLTVMFSKIWEAFS
jgi:hypothetical protein